MLSKYAGVLKVTRISAVFIKLEVRYPLNDKSDWPMKFFFGVLGVALLLCSCETNKNYKLLTRELNTAGIRHTVTYDGARPVKILYETFHGTGARDTTTADSILRREVDSVKFDPGSQTILLTRLFGNEHKDFRKYYFNSDNLLTKITRFDSDIEYITDSVKYDYTMRKASFYDLINKHVYELVYDSRNNIETETEKRIGDHHLYQTFYYYYDASGNPFLVNLDEDEELFGCFNLATVGLFWNNASRPLFCSKNNVQSFKEVTGTEERNGLFEYQYRHGVPQAQFGTDGVIYYRYSDQMISK